MNRLARSQVFPDCPFIKVYYKDSGIEVPVSSINVDEQGRVVSVTVKSLPESVPSESSSLEIVHDLEDDTTNGESEISADKVDIYQEFLEVPGVGYLKPGTLVSLDDDEYPVRYELKLGWYCNSSNQNMYGWYLHPLEIQKDKNPSNYMSHLSPYLFDDRTLYSWMVDHLNKITP